MYVILHMIENSVVFGGVQGGKREKKNEKQISFLQSLSFLETLLYRDSTQTVTQTKLSSPPPPDNKSEQHNKVVTPISEGKIFLIYSRLHMKLPSIKWTSYSIVLQSNRICCLQTKE